MNLQKHVYDLTHELFRGMIHQAVNSDETVKYIWDRIECSAHNVSGCQKDPCLTTDLPELLEKFERSLCEDDDDKKIMFDHVMRLVVGGCITKAHNIIYHSEEKSEE